MKKNSFTKEESSYKDPDGFVFYQGNKVYRRINSNYIKTFRNLQKEDFFKKLLTNKKVINFKEKSVKEFDTQAKAIFEVEKIPFISYPYEWSFSQLKDVALLTLEIQEKSLKNNFSLKDASAYNIQFFNGKPILIDLFSFEKYEDNSPWVAYKQFCEHFLGPLLLMKYTDVRLQSLIRTNIDGIPLDLVSSLLPKKTYLNPKIYMHVHLHAKNQKSYASTHEKTKIQKISKIMLLGIIDSLKSLIKNLSQERTDTEWEDYYTFTNYSQKSFGLKKEIISKYIETAKPKIIWDLGGNNGEFSRIASDKNIFTVCFDIDPGAVEKNYLQVKKNKENNLLPLISDLTNLSPNIGWGLEERKSLIDRKNADLVMALALIHHLSISKNIHFSMIAKFFSKLGKYLIIEFVPKNDSQVKKLLSTRKDIFPWYTESNFENEFKKYYKIIKKTKINNSSSRIMYLMETL